MSSVFAQRRQKLLSLKALRGSSPAPAHTEEACPAIPAGSRVRVLRIEGVKVIVSPLPVPTPGR